MPFEATFICENCKLIKVVYISWKAMISYMFFLVDQYYLLFRLLFAQIFYDLDRAISANDRAIFCYICFWIS